MKLKLINKPDKSSNKDPLIVFLEYGGGEDNQGVKIPAKKYVEKVNVGGVIEVHDQIGYAILGKYNECFQMLAEPEKKTKDVDPVKVETK